MNDLSDYVIAAIRDGNAAITAERKDPVRNLPGAGGYFYHRVVVPPGDDEPFAQISKDGVTWERVGATVERGHGLDNEFG